MRNPTNLPRPRLVNWIFRTTLRLTRRHGLHTLAKLNSFLLPQGELVDLPGRALLYVPPDPHFFGFVLGIHEAHITDVLLEFVEAGDVCVDVGANIGYFANIVASLVGPKGMVFAFEPELKNYETLKINADLANRYGGRVLPVRAAVSSRSGKLRVILGEHRTYHRVEACASDAGAEECVRSVRLDEELADHCTRVRVLKIDVEGHEPQVLEGCRGFLKAGLIQHIILEVTPGAGSLAIERIISEHSGLWKCWVNGNWIDLPLSRLPYRTDIWVRFPAL